MFLSSIFWMFLSYPVTVFLTFLGTVTLTAVVYLKSLFRRKPCLPKLYYKESSLSKHILNRCQTFQSQFKPPIWARSSHVQTLLGMCPVNQRLKLSRKYIQMQDEGVVSLGELDRVKISDSLAPIVIVVPDATGNKRIVAGIFEEAKSNHMRPVLFSGRGQNGNKLTTTKLTDYGDPSDLREVVQYLLQGKHFVKLSLIGIGAGGDLVMSYLGEYGSSAHVQSSVCISPTYDSETVYNEKIPKLYEIIYLVFLKTVLGKYIKHFSQTLDIRKIMKLWNFKDILEHVYCILNGHLNSEEYWENNSPLRDVDEISTPVLCISSIDDPVCSHDIIPYDLFTTSPNMFLVTTDYGGHAGFVHSLLSNSWTAKASIEYIKSFLVFECKQNGHSK
ncbi:hypothetical protein SNE40_003703 [Patella caerulea]|uniref:Uncharacterized protein n=2 Tax=Patella caerulea TaxID=87958 RepID=A0AAN8KIT0_PATCE